MIQRVRRVRETKTTENQTDEDLMIDPRKITATTGVEKIVKETMETTTMEVVTTTTPDVVRTNEKEKSKRKIARPEKVPQMGKGEGMTQIHRRTTIQIGETGTQRGTKRRTENPERNVHGAMTTEEEATHRLTVKRRMMATCPTDGEKDGGLHAVQNQVILKRPAQAIAGGKQNTP